VVHAGERRRLGHDQEDQAGERQGDEQHGDKCEHGVHAEAACGSFSSLIDRVLSHDESLKQVVVDAGAHPRQTDARDTGHGGGD